MREIAAEAPIIKSGKLFESTLDVAIGFIAVILGLFHLYTGLTGLRDFYLQRGVHLALILLIASLFMLKGAKSKAGRFLCAILVLGVIVPFVYFFGNYEYFATRLWGINFGRLDFATGLILIAAVFIIGQRIVDWIMPSIAALCILYMFVGKYLSGILRTGTYKVSTVVELCSWSEMGMFSTPIGVAASYLYLFILFGTVIEYMGTGETLIDIAKCIAGRSKGGPAKIAVVSSAMMGSISGSPIANVLTTGAFSIPFMKKLGFSAEYSAAVEAVAATGGMILPPVMGVLAFAMVDYSGFPYHKIILSAAIPACLYYIATFLIVHFHSLKLDMKPMDSSEITPFKTILRRQWIKLTPIFILAVPLCMGYTPLLTVSWACLSLFPISFIGGKEQWLTPKALFQCFVKSARNMQLITLPCALAGIIAGILSVVGVGVRLSSSLLNIAGGNFFILLLLVGVVTFIMGCGLPALLCYIIQLPITIPAMIAMGMPKMGAHLFVVYIATLAFITPPVGMSIYAAAGLAGTSFMKVGMKAFQVGSVAFMVPFIFAYCPSLLLLEFSPGVFFDIIAAIVACFAASVAVEGFLYARVPALMRIILFIIALMLFAPARILGVVGMGLTGAAVMYLRSASKRQLI
ncbi:C4-dicarboxylate ABC transporter [Synergistales bacterium]|nr:C4-dicarboxylate ABC transporter [Synergistales bacterium]